MCVFINTREKAGRVNTNRSCPAGLECVWMFSMIESVSPVVCIPNRECNSPTGHFRFPLSPSNG